MPPHPPPWDLQSRLTARNFRIAQYKAAIENLNSQMGEKTIEITNMRSKLSETEHLLSNRDKEVRAAINNNFIH